MSEPKPRKKKQVYKYKYRYRPEIVQATLLTEKQEEDLAMVETLILEIARRVELVQEELGALAAELSPSRTFNHPKHNVPYTLQCRGGNWSHRPKPVGKRTVATTKKED